MGVWKRCSRYVKRIFQVSGGILRLYILNIVFMRLLHRYWAGFLSWVFPALCGYCGVLLEGQEKVLCNTCALSLVFWPQDSPCHLRPFAPEEDIFADRWAMEKPLMVYEGIGAGMVSRFKYQGQMNLGYYLGRLLCRHLHNHGSGQWDFIIPVPMPVYRRLWRGFNQTEFLAKILSEDLGIPVGIDVLVRRRYTQRQVGKGYVDRWRNLRNIFRVRKAEKVVSRKILLIDDVVTTGATTFLCAQALIAAGAQTVRIVSVAGGASLMKPS